MVAAYEDSFMYVGTRRNGVGVSVVESLLSDIIDTKTKRMTRVIRSTL